MKQFHHIAVIMGGPSAERDISLRSGAAVAAALRTCGYRVDEVDVVSTAVTLPPGVEAVFVALHGTFGEDGQVQAIFRARGIPYTGSGVEASRLAFDKIASKQQFIAHGLPTPPFECITDPAQRTLPLPVVVKPARQGSSIGIHRVRAEDEWASALADARTYDDGVLVEAYIPGTELTVGVVGEMVLPVLQVRAPDDYYDYRAKYTAGLTEYLVPAPIAADCAERCRAIARRAFEALGCRDLARIDFRMNPEGELYILEANTIPGFTETSLLPKAALAAGIDFPELCDRIMQRADVH